MAVRSAEGAGTRSLLRHIRGAVRRRGFHAASSPTPRYQDRASPAWPFRSWSSPLFVGFGQPDLFASVRFCRVDDRLLGIGVTVRKDPQLLEGYLTICHGRRRPAQRKKLPRSGDDGLRSGQAVDQFEAAAHIDPWDKWDAFRSAVSRSSLRTVLVRPDHRQELLPKARASEVTKDSAVALSYHHTLDLFDLSEFAALRQLESAGNRVMSFHGSRVGAILTKLRRSLEQQVPTGLMARVSPPPAKHSRFAPGNAVGMTARGRGILSWKPC